SRGWPGATSGARGDGIPRGRLGCLLSLFASFMLKHSRGQEVFGRNQRELVDRCTGALHRPREQSIRLPQTSAIQGVPDRARVREVRLTNAPVDVAAQGFATLRVEPVVH